MKKFLKISAVASLLALTLTSCANNYPTVDQAAKTPGSVISVERGDKTDTRRLKVDFDYVNENLSTVTLNCADQGAWSNWINCKTPDSTVEFKFKSVKQSKSSRRNMRTASRTVNGVEIDMKCTRSITEQWTCVDKDKFNPIQESNKADDK